jgi:lipopolysaccharide export LptBFGC system permease protein LptF
MPATFMFVLPVVGLFMGFFNQRVTGKSILSVGFLMAFSLFHVLSLGQKFGTKDLVSVIVPVVTVLAFMVGFIVRRLFFSRRIYR